MMPKIVPIYAAAIALMFVILAVRVTRLRRVKRIAIGSSGDARLERAIRVHANFSEYVPLTLLLLAFVEMQGNSAWLIHFLALALVAGRLVHAYVPPGSSIFWLSRWSPGAWFMPMVCRRKKRSSQFGQSEWSQLLAS